ncbi:unnamed protein product [Amoebophrya sp. A120]|nr:unnamed protein product [Amoebophrya sp. A120]|eukprot:GSA120T00010257001.1
MRPELFPYYAAPATRRWSCCVKRPECVSLARTMKTDVLRKPPGVYRYAVSAARNRIKIIGFGATASVAGNGIFSRRWSGRPVSWETCAQHRRAFSGAASSVALQATCRTENASASDANRGTITNRSQSLGESLARNAKRALREGVEDWDFWRALADKTTQVLPTLAVTQIADLLAAFAAAEALVVNKPSPAYAASSSTWSTAERFASEEDHTFGTSSSRTAQICDFTLFRACSHAIKCQLELQGSAADRCSDATLTASAVKKLLIAFSRLRYVDVELVETLEQHWLLGRGLLGAWSAKDGVAVLQAYVVLQRSRLLVVPGRSQKQPAPSTLQAGLGSAPFPPRVSTSEGDFRAETIHSSTTASTVSIHSSTTASTVSDRNAYHSDDLSCDAPALSARYTVWREILAILSEDCHELSPPELARALECLSLLRIQHDSVATVILTEAATRLHEFAVPDLLRLLESHARTCHYAAHFRANEASTTFDMRKVTFLEERLDAECDRPTAPPSTSCADFLRCDGEGEPEAGSLGVVRRERPNENEGTLRKNPTNGKKNEKSPVTPVADEEMKSGAPGPYKNKRANLVAFGGAAAGDSHAQAKKQKLQGAAKHVTPPDAGERTSGGLGAECSRQILAGGARENFASRYVGEAALPLSEQHAKEDEKHQDRQAKMSVAAALDKVTAHLTTHGLGQLPFPDMLRLLRTLQQLEARKFDTLLFHKKLAPRFRAQLKSLQLQARFEQLAELLELLSRVPTFGEQAIELVRDVVDLLASLPYEKRTVRGLSLSLIAVYHLGWLLGTDSLENCLLVGGSDRTRVYDDERVFYDPPPLPGGSQVAGHLGLHTHDPGSCAGLLCLHNDLLKPAPPRQLDLLDRVLARYYTRSGEQHATRTSGTGPLVQTSNIETSGGLPDRFQIQEESILGAARRARTYLRHFLNKPTGAARRVV